MKRVFAASIVAIICLISSACSYSVNFVVINNSDSVLEVEYTILGGGDNPARISLAEWNKWFGGEKEWREIPQDEYRFEPETGKYKLKIAPNEVVKIFKRNDWMYSIENYQDFELINIQLTGESGKVGYEGNQIFKQFEEKNYSNRFIAYK
jgi:hypothetical protein